MFIFQQKTSRFVMIYNFIFDFIKSSIINKKIYKRSIILQGYPSKKIMIMKEVLKYLYKLCYSLVVVTWISNIIFEALPMYTMECLPKPSKPIRAIMLFSISSAVIQRVSPRTVLIAYQTIVFILSLFRNVINKCNQIDSLKSGRVTH